MIRPYQVSDLEEVLALCEEFWQVSCAEKYGAFDHDHAKHKFEVTVSQGVCLVLEENGVKGMLLLVEDTMLCCPVKLAADVAWYVTPGARGKSGVKLLEAGMRYCQLKQIPFMSMMFMQTSMPDTIRQIYDRMGFELAETTYVKRLF